MRSVVLLLPVAASALLQVELERRLASRDNLLVPRGPFKNPLNNHRYEYVASLEIGSPPQVVEVTLDTGSSDLWVMGPRSQMPKIYDRYFSSSLMALNKKFSIQYISGSAQGDWIVDHVGMGPAVVRHQQFAVVDNVNSQFQAGVLGIGFGSDEATRSSYVNFPQNLVDQGLISRNMYSLHLNRFNASRGSITFGGIDEDRYYGHLDTVPLQSSTKFEVKVQVEKYGNGEFNGLLDSGTTLTYLPDQLAQRIAGSVGAEYDAAGGYYRTIQPVGKPLTFVIGKTRITVPPEELSILDYELGEPTRLDRPYVFGISRAKDAAGKFILGDTFLRSAYCVFDLDNKEISIAQSVNDFY